MNHKVVYLMALELLIGIAISASIQIQTVEANVPSIVSVSFHDVGSSTWLDITVSHQGSIGVGHYVSNIQLEINGTVQNLSQSPQNTETFNVEYNLGPNTDSYSVRVRALCNIHGYSAQSNPVVVSEPMSIVMLIAVTAFAVVLAKKTLIRNARTSTTVA